MKLLAKSDYDKKSKDEIIDEFFEEVKKRDEEIECLKKELRKYKNSNTPSSAHQHLKTNTQVSAKSGKRGAPNGHIGVTRSCKKGDETCSIIAEECPRCFSKDIELVGKKHQKIEKMPPDIQPITVDVIRDVSKCNECNLKFVARDGVTP